MPAELWRLFRRWEAFRGEIDPTSFTTPHSLTGWPAATVRSGTSPEGLPIDVQLVAHSWRDDVALAAALRVEQASL